jgi:sialic acid synthase SpsE
MSVKVITDPGSCHMAKKDYAIEHIKVAKDCGADAVKFQLFKDKPPNIELPREWFLDLVDYGRKTGIEVFASAFDTEAEDLMWLAGCKSVKFAYKYKYGKISYPFETVYASFDVMNLPKSLPTNFKTFYVIPEYPVKYEISFDGIFPRFDGFSDHTLSYRQTLKAVKSGATIIEKHFCIDKEDIHCPDADFAIHPQELCKMVKEIRSMSCGY